MSTLELTASVKDILQVGANNLKGSVRRVFMAKVVRALGPGGQRQAEAVLGWNRGTIRKGEQELESGQPIVDNFSARGRKQAEVHLPNLRADIRTVVDPESQTDPSFRSAQLYTRLTAEEVRRRLIAEKGYPDEELPTVRTFNTKLNELGYKLKKVAKSKPIKKIPETDAIFEQVHKVNQEADADENVLRISIDSKARVKIGPFARNGKSRHAEGAADHDFDPEEMLTPFGIFLPAQDETFLFFTQSKVTADFIVDALESLWACLQTRFPFHTLVINADNGPENSSRRTQFIKRLVDLAQAKQVTIRLAHYPPYHSKYNPIERVWAILENHWNGVLLDSVQKVLGFAETMTWNDKHPVVRFVEELYQKGVKLSKKAMAAYEVMIERLPSLEDWFVDIPPAPA